jgi:predicted nuclease of predicted toxin-antitoxin system
MAIKLYLDEDVDPLLARVLQDRGVDCLSTRGSNNLGRSDSDQLTFAVSHGRAILTFNVKDFVQLSREYAIAGRHHSGIIVSAHIPFRELLRYTLVLISRHAQDDLTDKLLWLQHYKDPDLS